MLSVMFPIHKPLQDAMTTPPTTNSDEKGNMEEAFKQRLEDLSIHEHEKILLDVHGLGYMDKDPPGMDGKLCELDKEINNIKKKHAFERARYWNQSYVDDRPFRIMFLRAKSYDAQLAAELMVRHFEYKKDLFGDGRLLGRNIRISDLDEEALRVLKSGSAQILPTRDAAGRGIDVLFPRWDSQVPPFYVCRAMWYYYMAALRDELNQKNGFVSVFFDNTEFTLDAEVLEQMRASLFCIPAKFSVVHYCMSEESKPATGGVHQMLKGDELHLLRNHVGDPAKLHFHLQTFGIPTDRSPLQADGSWATTEFQEWLESHRKIELKEPADVDDVITPRRHDVLFGRRKKCRQHTGNLRLVRLCESLGKEYETASNGAKAKITQGLLRAVKESNGRFLKWEMDGWAEAGDIVAKQKISHFFRHMRSKGSTFGSQPAKSGQAPT